ncbi:hypothetical protein TREES_T100006738 [Tupaia chinensis]|uniref:Uncharacterized protein n=1 Tax=Tupaia chinensis TaxID=246437 RepID=L9KNM2_TUPCH|nr:hypothetical protein TREES_T100006738 [Tupaia chinensis]
MPGSCWQPRVRLRIVCDALSDARRVYTPRRCRSPSRALTSGREPPTEAAIMLCLAVAKVAHRPLRRYLGNPDEPEPAAKRGKHGGRPSSPERERATFTTHSVQFFAEGVCGDRLAGKVADTVSQAFYCLAATTPLPFAPDREGNGNPERGNTGEFWAAISVAPAGSIGL